MLVAVTPTPLDPKAGFVRRNKKRPLSRGHYPHFSREIAKTIDGFDRDYVLPDRQSMRIPGLCRLVWRFHLRLCRPRATSCSGFNRARWRLARQDRVEQAAFDGLVFVCQNVQREWREQGGFAPGLLQLP